MFWEISVAFVIVMTVFAWTVNMWLGKSRVLSR